MPDTQSKVRELADKELHQFHLSTRKLIDYVAAGMTRQLDLGLSKEDEAAVKCYFTYVFDRPTGEEQGTVLALDLGGTNFRTLMIDLPSGRELAQETFKISEDLMVGENGTRLFEFIATELINFVINYAKEMKKKDASWQYPTRYPLGFTFSFPCYQYGLSYATLVRWTKGFNINNVEGANVAKLLREAIHRIMLRNRLKKFTIDVVAVVNDTTGTLMSCAWREKNCSIGLIVGTGTNACYYQKLAGVEKWKRNYENPNMIINCEWGAFGENGTLKEIVTPIDVRLDEESINPTRQIFEKMIAGLYLGELCRLAMDHLAKQKLLFNGQLPQQLAARSSFPTEMVSRIESGGDIVAKRILMTELGLPEPSPDDLYIVRLVCQRISARAAKLTAAALVAIGLRTDQEEVVVGYDGTVMKKHPKFKSTVEDTVKKLLATIRTQNQTQPPTPSDNKDAATTDTTNTVTNTVPKSMRFVESQDGSGRGAAVIAAVAYRERRPKIAVRVDKTTGRLCVIEFTSYPTKFAPGSPRG